jgi:hypothetical protein
MKLKFWSAVAASTALLAAALLTGCSTGREAGKVSNAPERVSASQKRIPKWISDIPEDAEYLYYVGSSTDTESFDAGKKEAVGDALSQVVATIGIKATSTATFEERFFAEEYTTTIQTELITEGRAKLQDAEISEIYYEQWSRPDGSEFFRVWLLLKYSRAEIAAEQARLEEILRLKYGEVQHFEAKAAEYTQQGRLIDAVSAHLSASASALKIDDGEVFFDRNIIRASELLLKTRLRKSGEDQVGWVGSPLPEPLVLQVYYLDGENEVPVPGAPIRFGYRVPKTRSAGYKWSVSSAVTDQKGTAGFDVQLIHEVSDENRVDARIDLSSQMSQLRSAPSQYRESIEALEDALNRTRAVFLFKSDTKAREIMTAAYFMQFDKSGGVIVKPAAAPAFYDVLYGKDFAIRIIDLNPEALVGADRSEILQELDARAPKNALRILYGTVRIVEHDTLSGYEVVRAMAEVSLLDRKSGDIIRTWQLQRSGTGSSREAAEINALVQVGSSLGEIVSNTIP